MGTEKDQMKKKQKEERTTTRVIPATSALTFEIKHSAARHSTAAQGKAQHRMAPHGAALLGYI